MVKFGRYFVQFIVWIGIPSSLKSGMDVVLKSRKSNMARQETWHQLERG